MDATELRIGNIIGMNLKEFPQNWFRVLEPAQQSMKVTDSWNKDVPRMETDFYDADLMEGIPLSDEILKMCGYQYANENGQKYYWNVDLPYFQLRKDDDGDWYVWYEDTDVDDLLITMEPVNFLHQLQNTFRVLKGEELQIK